MSTRGRSASPQSRDVDVDMDKQPEDKPDAKVVVITNLTRNVVEAHLQSVFGFYGEVVKIDLPIYVKCAYQQHSTSTPFHLRTVVVFSLILTSCFILFFSLSRSKQRKSLPGIRRRGLRPHGHVPHERRTARRRPAQSRAIRRAPPTNARPHALALSTTPPPPKRARAPPLSFPLAFALAPLPTSG